MDTYETSRLFGPSQRPFRYGDGASHRPDWLVRAEPEGGELSDLWPKLVAHVANVANISGYFSPTARAWLEWSGLDSRRSRRLAEALKAAGALERMESRLYVVGWRDTYRCPDSDD